MLWALIAVSLNSKLDIRFSLSEAYSQKKNQKKTQKTPANNYWKTQHNQGFFQKQCTLGWHITKQLKINILLLQITVT